LLSRPSHRIAARDEFCECVFDMPGDQRDVRV
jgi:hypothetical protein